MDYWHNIGWVKMHIICILYGEIEITLIPVVTDLKKWFSKNMSSKIVIWDYLKGGLKLNSCFAKSSQTDLHPSDGLIFASLLIFDWAASVTFRINDSARNGLKCFQLSTSDSQPLLQAHYFTRVKWQDDYEGYTLLKLHDVFSLQAFSSEPAACRFSSM